MCPLKQWITQSVGNSRCPLFKFFPIGFISCAITFGNSIRAHGPPLVMISVQPNLGKVFKLLVFSNFLGRQMTMIIDDGHALRILMVQTPGCFIIEQKVLVQKWAHTTCFYNDLLTNTNLIYLFCYFFCQSFYDGICSMFNNSQ